MHSSKSKVGELQAIVSAMSLEACCACACALPELAELGLRWRDVTRAVRSARLPMTPSSVALVLQRHVAPALPPDDLNTVVAKLRLQLVATQRRTWHVVSLSDRISDEPLNVLARAVPSRVLQAVKSAKIGRNMRPEVQTMQLGDLVFISVRLVGGEGRVGGAMFAAAPPGEPVALFSSLHGVRLIKAIVHGLGYENYEDASLHGRDVCSLLRIHSRASSARAEHLAAPPQYRPAPLRTPSGLDYTNRGYDQQYVEGLMGPSPPLLTDLTVKSSKPFFDPSRLDKKMNLTVKLSSDDVAKTLKSWAAKGALAPTSDLFHIFHKLKSNKITYDADDLE